MEERKRDKKRERKERR